MKIDRFTYSKALSTVRQSDYAHPGETQHIDMLLKTFPEQLDISILDFGCGLGGTLAYIRDQGYRKIQGFDIDAESVDFARNKYGHDDFFHSLDNCNKQFDLIYSINVFYLIEYKNNVLSYLDGKATKNSMLLISDFAYKNDQVENKLKEYIPHAFDFKEPFNGYRNVWKMNKKIDISNHYIAWYDDFVKKIKAKKDKVNAIAGNYYYEYMLNKYQYLLELLKENLLGGIILILQRA